MNLYQICLKQVEILVNNSCSRIEDIYGNYDNELCKEQVSNLQLYLLLNIPGIVLDEVCDTRRKSSVVRRNRDPRIVLATYMHQGMRTFFVCESCGERKIGLDDTFWCTKLSSLQNIVILDMQLACTDEILEVVGKTCFKLEQINIISRLEPDQLQIKYTVYNFNALKLKFFISDIGLQHLKNCKMLKQITMNRMIRSQFGGKMMTEDGIRDLVKSLPYIESISYEDMGVVISQGMEDVDFLPLTYVSDYHAQARHMDAIARLCPNVKHLCLCIPSYNSQIAADILRTLSSTNLEISTLELGRFPFNSAMVNFFVSKGNFLTNLHLQADDVLIAKNMCIIGQMCPKLKHLHVKSGDNVLGLEEKLNPFPVSDKAMFRNLESLELQGSYWRAEVILPLLITHSKQLEKLVLCKRREYQNLDSNLLQILNVNPMKHLKYLFLYVGCFISISTIMYLVKHCPNIKELALVKHSNIEGSDIRQLHDDIKRYNLDLKVFITNSQMEI